MERLTEQWVRADLWADSDTAVDNVAHLLHHAGRTFPCDREIEALQTWRGHALLLSSDTDCLSLWDGEGVIRAARVGVYPQDMAVQRNQAYVCGGADGRLHVFSLPDLHIVDCIPLPSMVERIALHRQTAYLLTLLPEEPVQTALLALDLQTQAHRRMMQLPGIPGALAADEHGLWVGISEQVLHIPHGTESPDLIIDGFGLPRRIVPAENGALVWDSLEEQLVHCTMQGVSVVSDEDTKKALILR